MPPNPIMVLLTYIDLDEPYSPGDMATCKQRWFISVREPRKTYVQSLTSKHFQEIEDMKRYNQEAQKSVGKWSPTKDDFVKGMPKLDGMLTDAWWDDGKPREVCSLTVRLGNGQAVVSINDPDAEQSITTTAETVREAMERLEAYLGQPHPSWRPWGKKKR